MAFGGLKGTLQTSSASITNPFDATGSVSVAVGDLIVSLVAQQIDLTVTGVTDNLGHTYTDQNAGSDATDATGRLFYIRATAAGTLTTVSAATTASGRDAAHLVCVFEGPFTAPPIDANPANILNDVTDPCSSNSTGALSQADELVVGWCVGAATANNPAPTGTVSNTGLALGASNNIRGAISYVVVAATTAVTASFNFTSDAPNNSVIGVASFKKEASGGLTQTATHASDDALAFVHTITRDVRPSLFADTDTLIAPAVGRVLQPTAVHTDSDAFFTQNVGRVLSPVLYADSDVLRTPLVSPQSLFPALYADTGENVGNTHVISQGGTQSLVPSLYDETSAAANLLLHFDGADTSTTFTDSSGHGHTATPSGDAQISTTQSKFGGSGGKFDGTGDYLTLDASSDFAFGTGDFTIDFWVWIDPAMPAIGYFYDGANAAVSGSPYLTIFVRDWTLRVGNDRGDSGFLASTVFLAEVPSVWHHVAVVRSGGMTNCYVDGVGTTAVADTTNYIVGTDGPVLGKKQGGTPWYFNGYLDEFRIIKGTAAWTSDFTPPSAAYGSGVEQLIAPTVSGADASQNLGPSLYTDADGVAFVHTIANVTQFLTPTKHTDNDSVANTHTIATAGQQNLTATKHTDTDSVAFVHTIANLNQFLLPTKYTDSDNVMRTHVLSGGAVAFAPIVVGPVAGTGVYIAAGSPDDFIEIAEIASMGEVGIRYDAIQIIPVVFGQDYERKIKGNGFSPAFNLVCNRKHDDIGQAALIFASSDPSDDPYHFKIVETDGVVTTFEAKVFGLVASYGSVNEIVRIAADIEIDPETIVMEVP